MELSIKKRNNFLEYAAIAFGVLLLAMAISIFFEPLGLVTGGVSGLGIIIRSVSLSRFEFDIPLWLTNLVLNLPLFIIGAKVKGMAFLRRTLFATLFFSPALYVTSLLPQYIPTLDMTGIDTALAAVFGGAVSGTGLGIVFRYSATTGGSDLAASIISKVKPHIAISKIMFIIDSIVISLGFLTFGASSAMYAVIAVFISSRIIGAVLEGLTFATAAFIISDKHEEISERILTKLERGVTSLRGTGMYTKKDKGVVLCVVAKKEIFTLKELVYAADDRAFVIVTDAREVLGEGFNIL